MRYIKLKDGTVFSFITGPENVSMDKRNITESPLYIKSGKIHELNSSGRNVSNITINKPDDNIIAKWNEDN
jgi:hypothetical protein